MLKPSAASALLPYLACKQTLLVLLTRRPLSPVSSLHRAVAFRQLPPPSPFPPSRTHTHPDAARQALLSSSPACFAGRFQAAADGSTPRDFISEELKINDPDSYYGMKDLLCSNTVNHDTARLNTGSLCWSCRVPLSAEAAAAEALHASRIKLEDDTLFGTDAERVECSARSSIERGVCVRWLVHFTHAHGCWSWPTWRVVENIIKVPLFGSN